MPFDPMEKRGAHGKWSGAGKVAAELLEAAEGHGGGHDSDNDALGHVRSNADHQHHVAMLRHIESQPNGRLWAGTSGDNSWTSDSLLAKAGLMHVDKTGGSTHLVITDKGRAYIASEHAKPRATASGYKWEVKPGHNAGYSYTPHDLVQTSPEGEKRTYGKANSTNAYKRKQQFEAITKLAEKNNALEAGTKPPAPAKKTAAAKMAKAPVKAAKAAKAAAPKPAKAAAPSAVSTHDLSKAVFGTGHHEPGLAAKSAGPVFPPSGEKPIGTKVYVGHKVDGQLTSAEMTKVAVPHDLTGMVTETHDVKYGGVDIGQVHKAPGGWIATFPNNGGGLPAVPTQAEAAKGLIQFHLNSKAPAVDKAPDWVGKDVTYHAAEDPFGNKYVDVKLAGQDIGSVHGPDGFGHWSAVTPDGATHGGYSTRDGAAALLYDHHKLGPVAPTKKAAAPKAPVKKAAAAKMTPTKAAAKMAPTPAKKAAPKAPATMVLTPSPSSPTETHHVHFGGEHLGSVRKQTDGYAKGYWTAHGPDGSPIGDQYNNIHVTKLQAANALKAHHAKAKKEAAAAAKVSAGKVSKVPGKPGVTWTPKKPVQSGSGWSAATPKQTQDIHLNGVHIGTIHEQQYGGWKANLPGGQNVDLGYSKAGKAKAVDALLAKQQEAESLAGPHFTIKAPGLAPPGQKPQYENVLSPPTAGAKFEILADPGENGDGYAPGGQWGKFGAAGVLIQSTAGGGEPKYLLVQRGPKVKNNQGKWQLPGGALNGNENAYQGAARETVEEVGAPPSHLASLKPVGENVYTDHSTGWKYTTIAATTAKTFTPKVDGTETSDAKWFTRSEIDKLWADGQLVPKLDKALGPIIDSYPSKPTKITAAEKMVRGGDFSKMRRVGMQAGSNEGGVFEAPDGSQWYVKAQKSAEHANNEAAASAFYRAAGVDAPEVIRGSGAPGLSGTNHTATRMYPNAKQDLKAHVLGADKGVSADRSYMAKVHEGFAMDAWLGNWDVAGSSFDNILTVNGSPVRVDPGGALLFRAQGEPKGKAFGPTVPEWDTFTDKTSSKPTAALFDSMTSAEMVKSADKVKAFTPAKIRAMVKANKLEPSLADTLIERRKNILARAKLEAAKPRKAFAEGALTGDKALAAVEIKNTYAGKLAQRLTNEGVPSGDAYSTVQAIDSYKGSGYEQINSYLLGKLQGGPTEAEKAAEKVRLIDIAFAHSVLPSDIVVYRGERNISRNFPPGDWSLVGGMEGKEWTFPAYASTGTDKKTAEAFASGFTSSSGPHGATAQPSVLRIVAPKGTGAIGLDEPGSYEKEVLLNRHLRYRVVKDHGVTGGVRNLDVMVVGS